MLLFLYFKLKAESFRLKAFFHNWKNVSSALCFMSARRNVHEIFLLIPFYLGDGNRKKIGQIVFSSFGKLPLVSFSLALDTKKVSHEQPIPFELI